MKIGASARGNNDIDLFRRPAGLADGLALKEPAPRDAQVAVRPNKLVPPSPGIPPGVRLGRALYKVRRRTQARDASTLRTFRVPSRSCARPARALAFVRVRTALCAATVLMRAASLLAGCGGGGRRRRRRDAGGGHRAGAGARPGWRRGAGRDRARLPRVRDDEHDARRRRRRDRQRRRRRPGRLSRRAATTPARAPSRSSTRRDWRVAVSAAQLMAPPLRAPILFSDGGELPAATEQALGRLVPTGAKEAGGAQVIRVGEAAVAEGYKTTAVEGADYAALAQAIDRLHTAAAGKPSPAVVVASSEQPGFSMPAAGWAAKSGDPVLWVTRDAIPPATRAAITAHKRPRIYVLGPESAVSKKVLDAARRARRRAPDQRPRPGRERDRVRALLRRLVRLERRRPGPRARVRDHAAPARRGRRARRCRRRAPTGRCCSSRRRTRCPRRCRTTCSTSSPATTRTPSAASTTTAG